MYIYCLPVYIVMKDFNTITCIQHTSAVIIRLAITVGPLLSRTMSLLINKTVGSKYSNTQNDVIISNSLIAVMNVTLGPVLVPILFTAPILIVYSVLCERSGNE